MLYIHIHIHIHACITILHYLIFGASMEGSDMPGTLMTDWDASQSCVRSAQVRAYDDWAQC